ncbi:hypothetical protein HDF16_003856 [Granulicella aggregans]|uniref:Peptidase S53 domain-containing protein n=1 Tax=Granulicella aggregans TaxID=474949 RepID=A0A7W8E4J4_9BACT|nr:protease pro-enzyme activation domain-containing protein [Granulicella aggregans]MBB5059133.1 hypothetical protein [Granulicella aggregans]
MKLIRTRKMFRPALGVVATVLLSATAMAQGAVSGVSPRRVLQAVDASDRVSLNASVRPWVTHAKDLGTAPASTAAPKMLLLLNRSAEQQQALSELLGDLQNPASPRYHHWLTPAQFGDTFGMNADDLQSVTSWLQSQGFTVTKVAKARNVIEFSGNVGQVQQAFNTRIHRLSVDGTQTMTSVTPVQVPRALAAVIKGLVNLDSAKPHASVTQASRATYDSSTHRIKPDLTLFDSTGANPYLYMDPADAATVYDTPNATLNANYSGTTLDGTGINVGIVGDSNVDLTSVSNYRQAFLNETADNVNLPTIVVDGSDPGINGDEVESFLDLEVLGGIAPKANLYYYTSDSSDLSSGLVNAIGRAIEDNVVSILSISYSSCEANQGTAGNAFFAELYQQADAQGITITVSSGDSGPANCDNPNAEHVAANGLVVNALGSTPYNVSVGGTDFDALASDFSTYVDTTTSGVSPYFRTALKYIPERPWNDSTRISTSTSANVPLTINGATNIIAAGSGVSSVYAKPDFQTALTPADGARDMPDVSFLAANGLYGATWVLCEGGILGYDCLTTDGQFTDSTTFSGAGGTSASTPAFAGMLALVEQSTGSRLGQANDVLYRLAGTKYSTVFHDVVTGDNAVVCDAGTSGCGSNGFTTGYDAVPGYDLASGLGSVDVAALVANWGSASGTSTATTLKINGAGTPVSVTHGTSLDINVAVSPTTASGSAGLVASTSLIGGQLAIPLTNGVGTTTYNGLPGGTYTLYARYGGDASDAASSSSPISINIASEPSTTNLTVNAYTALTASTITTNNAIPYGSYIFSDAFVFGTAEGQTASLGQATGTVTFLDNGSAIGTGDVTALDYASFPGLSKGVYPFTAGTHVLTASYAGDASYQANVSAPVSFTMLKGTMQISVVPASAATNTVTNDIITVNLATNGLGAVPTGTVTLQANGVTLGSTSTIVQGAQANGLVFGFATITIKGSDLQQGANTLTATYTGDSNYVAGTANVVVTSSKATFSLSASPISVTAGSTTGDTTTVRVTPLNDFTGVINLTCAVTSAPAGATSPVTCAVPATVNVSGLGAVAGTLTVNTTSETTGGSYVVTITGVDALTGKLTATATSDVTVTGATLTPAFTLSNAGAIMIAPGASTGNTSVISVSPAGGFTGAVALSCAVTSSPAGAADPLTCSLSNPTVTITGTAAATTTVTISSTAATTASLENRFGGGGIALGLMLIILPMRRRRFVPLFCLILLAGLGMMTGCSSSPSTPVKTANPGTSEGAYVVTVFGTASSVAPATTTVSVTVN